MINVINIGTPTNTVITNTLPTPIDGQNVSSYNDFENVTSKSWLVRNIVNPDNIEEDENENNYKNDEEERNNKTINRGG